MSEITPKHREIAERLMDAGIVSKGPNCIAQLLASAFPAPLSPEVIPQEAFEKLCDKFTGDIEGKVYYMGGEYDDLARLLEPYVKVEGYTTKDFSSAQSPGEKWVSVETLVSWDTIKGFLRPYDSFLLRMGGEGFDTRIVIGREQANTAFALLFGDMGDEDYKRYLEYATDDDNWSQQEGDVIDLKWNGEAGWCEINRITLP